MAKRNVQTTERKSHTAKQNCLGGNYVAGYFDVAPTFPGLINGRTMDTPPYPRKSCLICNTGEMQKGLGQIMAHKDTNTCKHEQTETRHTQINTHRQTHTDRQTHTLMNTVSHIVVD